ETAGARPAAHAFSLPSDRDPPPRHEAGAGGDVEQAHALAQSGPPQGVAAIPAARAKIQHGADPVVVAGAAIEQVRDEPLSLVGARVVFVQNRMRRDYGRGVAPLAVGGRHQKVTGRALSPLKVTRCSRPRPPAANPTRVTR